MVGRQVTINTVTYTIAGVMPAALSELVTTRTFPDTEIWTLLGYAQELPQACRSCRHIFMIARLRANVEVSEAEADLTRIYQALSVQFPLEYAQPRAVVTPIRDYFLGPVRQPLLLLWSAVGRLLLMACANIANLLLIRATEREEEIAIRRALGVSPARMLRQLLTESVALAIIGGTAGALLAWWSTSLLSANGPAAIPRLNEVAVNGRVLIYSLGVSLFTGILFGMATARMVIHNRNDGKRTTAGPGVWRFRAGLIAVNVALSALLLVGSGLLVRSSLQLLTVEPGFNPAGLLTLQMGLIGPQYTTNQGITRFYDDLSARVGPLPGVPIVSASTQLPLTGSIDRSGITIEGRPLANPAEAPDADRFAARPGYFRAMGIPLIRGRVLDERDGTGAPPVAVIGRTMADELWPGEDAIGHRIRVAGGPNNPMRAIVGVVGDVRHYGLHLPESLQVYVPHAQAHYPEPMVTMIVRVGKDRDPLSITSTVREQRARDRPAATGHEVAHL